MKVTMDELVRAVRHRLGIQTDDPETARYEQIWQWVFAAPQYQQYQDGAIRFLGPTLEQAVRRKMGLTMVAPRSDEAELLDGLWDAVSTWLKKDFRTRSPVISRLILESLESSAAVAGGSAAMPAPQALMPTPPPSRPAMLPPQAVMPTPPSRPAMPHPQAVKPPLPPGPPRPAAPHPQAGKPPLPPVPRPAAPHPQAVKPPLPPVEASAPATSAPEPLPILRPLEPSPPAVNPPSSQPVRPGPTWRYVPVPEGSLERHDDSAQLETRSPDGWPLVAARVRGKTHKHDGTNCDDWFAVRASGRWTLIAVADGAGSKRLSRIGARASCDRAIEALSAALERTPLPRPGGLEEAVSRRHEDRRFVDPDLEAIQAALHEAMKEALAAVEGETNRRSQDPAYEAYLGRKPELNDFSATLLLAVHVLVNVGNQDRSLVMACQVGDGMIAAIGPGAQVHVLAQPDSGEFSGQTDFLTSRHKVTPPELRLKTFALCEPLLALLVMTDGVADDYFPADPGMARLYADLVLNGILPVGQSDGAGALTYPPGECPFDREVETMTQQGPHAVQLRSAEAYAAKQGLALEQLAAQPTLLRAGAWGTPLAGLPTLADRLRAWLDAYLVRGSFDDRTLVALHRAEAP